MSRPPCGRSNKPQDVAYLGKKHEFPREFNYFVNGNRFLGLSGGPWSGHHPNGEVRMSKISSSQRSGGGNLHLPKVGSRLTFRCRLNEAPAPWLVS